MKYPSMQEFIKNNFGSNSIISVDDTFDMIEGAQGLAENWQNIQMLVNPAVLPAVFKGTQRVSEHVTKEKAA